MADIEKYLEIQANLAKSKLAEKAKKNQISDSYRNKYINKQPEPTVAAKIEAPTMRPVIPSTSKSPQDSGLPEDEKDSDSPRHSSESEYLPSDEESDVEYPIASTSTSVVKRIHSIHPKNAIKIEKYHDDGDIEKFNARVKKWKIQKKMEKELGTKEDGENETKSEYHKIDGSFKVPKSIWNGLYKYQKTGVKWLWELHQLDAGGLLGDEMGLGKTVQVIAFLAGLNVSGGGTWGGLGPSIIVAPATVVHQWVQHFHRWWPPLRVAVLHQSGSHIGPPERLIRDIHNDHGILVTTYAGITKHKLALDDRKWHYIILDEGHKIRNNDTQVSKVVKKIRTPHRIIVTGSPMQNNLQELWSLFDFMSPGLLGTMLAFMEHFANPITQGGYANATPMQETTALSLAIALKNTITPYMLRRTKIDVRTHLQLPEKNEQVLFCSLSPEQKDLYMNYLTSSSIRSILDKESRYGDPLRGRILVALTTLRKICNHPDLFIYEIDDESGENDLVLDQTFGFWKRSGKMVVINSLLKIWKKQGHKVLIFTQSRAMILIIENFLQQNSYKYLKMDGSTSIGSRQPLITKFNEDKDILVFLATTRVGGLGVNLTGADRVIIYDPDWNPATDSQAKERAWRIGQLRNVTVYRLLSAGTIEEKIYQRQVFKQLLSNKVLLDPNQKNYLKTSTLQGLFSFEEPDKAGSTETTNIFKHTKVLPTDHTKQNDSAVLSGGVSFSKNKMEAMRRLAQQISKKISSTTDAKKEEVKEDPRETYKKKLLPPKPPEEPPEVNLIDDKETNVDFSSALSELDIVNLYSKPEPLDFLYKSDNEKEEGELSNDGTITACDTVTNDVETTINDGNSESLNDNDGEIVNADNSVTSNHDMGETLKIAEPVDDITIEKIVQKTKDKKHKSKKRKYEDNSDKDREFLKSIRKVKHKREKIKMDVEENHDQYVLDKLFAKSGVQSALQHDKVVGLAEREERYRMRTEAQQKAVYALKALRKSRVKRWRW